VPLVDITGSRHLFDSQKRRSDEREIVQFLLADAGIRDPSAHR
jgi:hypothetical protein